MADPSRGTLVKQGHPEVLAILGYTQEIDVNVSKLQIAPPVVGMGDVLHFSFELRSTRKTKQELVIDYIVHHVKANGRRTPKVFKLVKRTLGAGESLRLAKKHSFRPISTRNYYPGRHLLEIQINGRKYGEADFELR